MSSRFASNYEAYDAELLKNLDVELYAMDLPKLTVLSQ